MADQRSEIVRWARGHRAAERRAARGRSARIPVDALEQALELWDLQPDLFDRAPDPVRVREVESARRVWSRLRQFYRGHRQT